MVWGFGVYCLGFGEMGLKSVRLFYFPQIPQIPQISENKNLNTRLQTPDSRPYKDSLIAFAFSRHSSYSFSGMDLAVMAPPTEKEAYFFFWSYTTERITTL